MTAPLYQQLYAYVVDEIRSGRLKPGERVPSEKELAEQFKVSRITSKKALESLMQAQVIERIRGKGSFVADRPALPAAATRPTPGAEPPPGQPVGMILPDMAESYGLRMLQAVEERLSAAGLPLLLKRTHGRQSEEEQAAEQMVSMGAAGLIVFPVHGEFYSPRLLRLVLDRFPLVLVDRYLKGIPACSIYTDNRRAAFELSSYLIELGHTEVAFVSPPPRDTSTIEERLQGTMAAFVGRGLPFRPEARLLELYSTLPGAFTAENIALDLGRVAAFVADHPEVTAYIACEYNVARVVERGLRQLGQATPADVSLVCFDSPADMFAPPQFTHILQDEAAIGHGAVELLLAQMAGAEVPAQTVVDFRLVEGGSSGPPRRGP